MTLSNQKYENPEWVIKSDSNIKIGDEEDIGEVSEGFMTRLHESILKLESSDTEEIPFERD
jgi:hypothetical protein